MKKLNITKEQFEKSRYFKNKYGKLEYVSESGNVYKTDKGKVLKFVKESSDNCWLGIEGLIDEDEYVFVNGNEIPKGDIIANLEEDFPELSGVIEDSDLDAWLLAHKEEVKEMAEEMAWAYDESSKKFGRKFTKENVGVTTSTGGHYAAFLTDMIAGFLEKQRGIDDVEHGDDGILVTFSDGGQVAVSFDAV